MADKKQKHEVYVRNDKGEFERESVYRHDQAHLAHAQAARHGEAGRVAEVRTVDADDDGDKKGD